MTDSVASAGPPPPRPRLSIGVTGHRLANAAFAANAAGAEAALSRILDRLEGALAASPPPPGSGRFAPVRLHSLLAEGFDQLAADQALARGWDLTAPLPFGRALNRAINAAPQTADEARFLLTGEGACGAATLARSDRIRALEAHARLFELAEMDEPIAALHLARLRRPADLDAAQAYIFRASERIALAARVMIEQSDLIVACWDGAGTSAIGGTGHTVALALEMGSPVVWIDARAPADWRLLTTPESLAAGVHAIDQGEAEVSLARLVQGLLRPAAGGGHGGGDEAQGLQTFEHERWRPLSHSAWHAYRRIEALFGADRHGDRFRSLTQVYEAPDAIAEGAAAGMLAAAAALPGQDAAFVERVEREVLRRFAFADGISARLSDAYRGGMILSFLFSALAIVGGIAYLPFATLHEKWMFTLFELALLTAILAITFVGQKRRWHARWFETRRVAEYFRHAPILLFTGVARPLGRWPRATGAAWPEWYARQALRDIGLPTLKITSGYLRRALGELLLDHVARQEAYHRAKARRLGRTHHRLDKLSEGLFGLAVVSVSVYLALKAGAVLRVLPDSLPYDVSLLLTFFGVLLPTFGAGLAGIRYFGDFERFAAISEVTAEKLAAVAGRIELLLSAPDGAIDYARAADLVRTTDDIVVSEIENWQAVFGGKHITVPV